MRRTSGYRNHSTLTLVVNVRSFTANFSVGRDVQKQGEHLKRAIVGLSLASAVAALAIIFTPAWIVEHDSETLAPLSTQVATPAPTTTEPATTIGGSSPQASATAVPTESASATPPPADAPTALTPATATAVGNARQAVLFSVGGVIAIVTLVLSYARHRREEGTAALAQDSNLTDRYTQAVDQLGSEAVPIQLGGIYALERLARDSKADRQTIADVLAAFLRETSPVKPLIADDPQLGTPQSAAALVLGRLQSFGSSVRIDLTNVNLRRAALENADFRGAVLMGAHLNSTNLNGARLDGADLKGATFLGTYMVGANLTRVEAVGATFQGIRGKQAIFIEANLAKCSLPKAGLQAVDFTNANLRAVADMIDAKFAGAHLRGADFRGAKLKGANFSEAHLEGAKLDGAFRDGAIGLP